MSGLETTSDGDLLRRMLAGSEPAFTALYRRYQGRLYRFAIHMSGNAAVAEEATQEVFLALLREGARYDSGRGSLEQFLYGVARKQVLRHLEKDRRRENEEDVAEMAGGDDVLGDLTRKETIGLLRKAVLSLPARYREVVVLCEMQEMDYASAAAVLGCAVGTVRSRLSRARALLAEKLRASKGCLA